MVNVLENILNFAIPLLALLMVMSKSLIRAIMAMLAVFVLGSLKFLIMGVAYLAFLNLMVYVGAVVVMFLFVVMMLFDSVKLVSTRVATFFAGALILIALTIKFYTMGMRANFTYHAMDIKIIALTMFNKYFAELFNLGLLLLSACIGAICILYEKQKSKQQAVFVQKFKTEGVKMHDPAYGKGIEIDSNCARQYNLVVDKEKQEMFVNNRYFCPLEKPESEENNAKY